MDEVKSLTELQMWDLEDLEAYLAYLAMKSDFQDAAYEEAKSDSGKKKGA